MATAAAKGKATQGREEFLLRYAGIGWLTAGDAALAAASAARARDD